MATAPLSSSTLIKSNILCPHSHTPSSFLPLNTFSKFKNHIRIPLLLRSLKPLSLRTASAIAVRAEFDASIQRYEQLLVDGGAMYVEVLNKGVRPLAYTVKKKNKAGETITYLDSIQILFTYFTKPESISIIGEMLQRDDDVIRSFSFKIRKRKY